MSKLIKVGLGLGLLAGAVYYLTGYAKKIASQFGFEVVGFGFPAIKGLNVVVPVVFKFNNPTSVPINPDNVNVEISLLKNNNWVLVANINEAGMTLPPGKTDQKINVDIDLKSVLGGNVFDTLQTVLNTYNTKSIPLHAEVAVTYQGVTLPKQIFDQTVAF